MFLKSPMGPFSRADTAVSEMAGHTTMHRASAPWAYFSA